MYGGTLKIEDVYSECVSPYLIRTTRLTRFFVYKKHLDWI